MKNKRILSAALSSILLATISSCAVKKDFAEIPTVQMPSKHMHGPLAAETAIETQKNSIESIQEKLDLVYFEFDSATLKKSEVKKVTDIAISLKKISPFTKLTILGHTDQVGTELYNQRLGLERANAVRDILIGEGITPEMLEVKSYGESKPKVKTSNRTKMDKNRRVVFQI